MFFVAAIDLPAKRYGMAGKVTLAADGQSDEELGRLKQKTL
jgi:hypothetical protein